MVYLLLILSVLSGITLGYFFGRYQKFAKRLLILSAGFLLSMTVLEVFPAVFQGQSHNIGLWILGGVVLQLILESLTKGFEHGHFHHHEEEKNIFPVALIAGMFVHAFIEGIPLSKMPNEITPYLQGILVHNIPISFVMGAFLLTGNYNKKIAWTVIALFALASPMGMLLGQYFNPEYQVYTLAVVSGIFLHISSVIIFEGNKNHKLDLEKIALVLVGIGVAYLGHLSHHH
ncbi:ZIP family metal transporter [Elizabethkingia meningoseptica]|uniref:ZIP family metal transporter n=1 Tax=Elizabethkingia meningoseptica TaxID=238 RepID=UPI0023B05F54|nr:ZIP family metal transporter [Elizabethkingia meningoseptica]MDE5437517.1 ZIP family metal transporter [Elizabethkingia meningoseptica]MDE5507385.1 ZIP family metal transporter [Elizabethkingia meningoseptica]MDE5515332.1 ZIP family metal transporter [Elizabethkingia meningoseptica]MDE5526280.1 ZIP family metal transporter [Elizabethkingia meningoseptica]MDE5529599.1 ZIP family metal transporter [Elizabethkingia meningoseptica]